MHTLPRGVIWPTTWDTVFIYMMHYKPTMSAKLPRVDGKPNSYRFAYSYRSGHPTLELLAFIL